MAALTPPETMLSVQAGRQDFLNALSVLSTLHRYWREVKDKDGSEILPSEFHNLELGDVLDLGKEYMLWANRPVRFIALDPIQIYSLHTSQIAHICPIEDDLSIDFKASSFCLE